MPHLNTQDTASIWYRVRHLQPSEVAYLYGLLGVMSYAAVLYIPDVWKPIALLLYATGSAMRGYIVANDNRSIGSLTRSTDTSTGLPDVQKIITPNSSDEK